MKFIEKLNAYMEPLSCSAREFGNLSGISGTSFSRYKSGERVPELGTKPFENLCSAIAEIAAQKKLPDITAESVKASFLACDDFVSTDKEVLRQNFNTMIAALNINLARLSQYTNTILLPFSAFVTDREGRETPSGLLRRSLPLWQGKCGRLPKSPPLRS